MDLSNHDTDGKSNRAHFQRDREMWVMQVLASEVSPTAKVIGVAIGIHMNGDSRQAWPSHSTLAKMCSVEKRTSERAVKELEKAGLLSVRRVANCSNRYEMRRIPTTGSIPTDMTEDDGWDDPVPTAVVPPPRRGWYHPPDGDVARTSE
jgi:Helix-turn-helix domain